MSSLYLQKNSFKLNCFGLTNHQTDIGKLASIYFNQLPKALDVNCPQWLKIDFKVGNC